VSVLLRNVRSLQCGRTGYDLGITHQQQPIGSGFTAAATADDVLAGLALTGKNVIVTGGHAGIGL